MQQQMVQRPTGAFVGASWTALLVGGATYLVGLWNSDMQLNEKGYYFTLLMYGLFSAVSLQKSVREVHLTVTWKDDMRSILSVRVAPPRDRPLGADHLR